jgi:hypothetical protein
VNAIPFGERNWHDSSIVHVYCERIVGEGLRITMLLDYIVSYDPVLSRRYRLSFERPYWARINLDGLIAGKDAIYDAEVLQDSPMLRTVQEAVGKHVPSVAEALQHFQFIIGNSATELDIIACGYSLESMCDVEP